jgi:hypothetical protein
MILKKFAESNAFIREEATETLQTMVQHLNSGRLLDALFIVAGDKAPVVRAKVSQTIDMIVQTQVRILRTLQRKIASDT